MTTPSATLQLLGGVGIRGLEGADVEHLLAQSKVVGLLAMLALAPAGVFLRRDRIVGLLWPELDQAHARSALRKALHVARVALGETVIDGRGDEELILNREVLGCDVADLLAAAERGQLARVVDLYRGDLMPGFHLPECHDFDAWLEEQRATLLEEVVAACWALAQHLESGDSRTDAAHFARRAARMAWSNERVLRRSLLMLDRLGDRAGALRLYDDVARRLKQELDAEPSPETAKLVAAMRGGRPNE